MSTLIQLDYWLFFLINSEWVTPFFDSIMPFLRNKYVWLPIYIFIITWVIYSKNGRAKWVLLLNIISCIAITDILCSQILKPFIARVRPCNELAFIGDVMERVSCGYGLSFPSIHAANHFALSIILIILFKPNTKIKVALMFWAFSISYAQVYVGLHYPLDIIGGALVGTVMARLFGEWGSRTAG